MAATITETAVVRQGGYTPDLIRVYGTAVTTAPTTSFVIAPGNNGTNVTGSKGLRKMLAWRFSNYITANPIKVVKSFNTTDYSDILTVTCTAADKFDFWVEGQDAGLAA